MARPPAQVSALLEALAQRLPVLLGRNLVGIYLYGSLTQQAFDPRLSDIDAIVVTRRQLTDTQFSRLRAWLRLVGATNPWVSRLQLTCLQRDRVLTMNARACHFQFGRLRRDGSDGNPIIWLNVLQSGVVLYGPRARTFVPGITSGMLFEALRREAGYLREEISDKRVSRWRNIPSYRVYAVLTLCRILCSSSTGTVVSKPRAARWAFHHLPSEWHPLIRRALSSPGAGRATGLPLSGIRKFIEFADRRLGAQP